MPARRHQDLPADPGTGDPRSVRLATAVLAGPELAGPELAGPEPAGPELARPGSAVDAGAGDDGAPPLVLIHGFTQNTRCWGPLVPHLGGDRTVTAVDLPGHGRSPVVASDLWATAALVGEAGGRADYMGYSLGGRVALHLALVRPDLVRRLVLVGATAGLADPDARAQRRRADDALADRIEREPLSDFLDRWLSQPIFRTLPPERAGTEARRDNTPAGLAASLRATGTGTQEPLWDRLGELRMPVLLLAGALDVRFAATADAMARAIGPNATLALVPGAGHACHLERPAHVGRLVRAFLC